MIKTFKMLRTLRALLLVASSVGALVGCEPAIKSSLDFGPTPTGDGATDGDLSASPPGADLSLNGSKDLAGSDGKPGADLAKPTDLAKPPDGSGGSWGSCSVAGKAGECITTSDCAAQGKMSTAGLCPGPSNVQCCTDPTPAPDGGTSGHLCPSTSYPTPNEGLYNTPG